jgi:hypothetical protein
LFYDLTKTLLTDSSSMTHELGPTGGVAVDVTPGCLPSEATHYDIRVPVMAAFSSAIGGQE